MHNKSPIEIMQSRILDNKYSRLYFNIIRKYGKPYTVKIKGNHVHHILPKCLCIYYKIEYIHNDPRNLISISIKTHKLLHILLCKMFNKKSIEYYKMCSALQRFSKYIKSGFGKYIREGANKDKIKIYNIKSNIQMYIDKNDEIPFGYMLGNSPKTKQNIKQSFEDNEKLVFWRNIITDGECKRPESVEMGDGWIRGRSLNIMTKIKHSVVDNGKRVGCKYIHNDKNEIKIIGADDVLPEGWVYGQTLEHKDKIGRKNSDIMKSKKYKWYTDGYNNIRISLGDPVPENYNLGKYVSEETKMKIKNTLLEYNRNKTCV